MSNLKVDNYSNLFNNVIDIFLHEIVEYIYEPTKYKIFMINNPNKITYREFSIYNLEKYLSIPIEGIKDKNKYPYKQYINRISINGSGRIGCKLKFIYIKKTITLDNFIKQFTIINKHFLKTVKKILQYPSIVTIKLKDNLNYKLFIKNLYDKYPNFYQKYFYCNYNVPNRYDCRHRKCLCYDEFTCDLCLLKGQFFSDRWYGDIYMCYNCKKELDDRRHERWEDKQDCYDDY